MTRLGIVVPSSNTIAEPEFTTAISDDCTVHTARMPLEDVTATELDAMADDAERAATLLSHAAVDALAYACTTGSLIHGSGFDTRLESRLAEVVDAPAVATARSVVRALRALSADRIAVVTPYAAELNRLERDYLTDTGFEVVTIDGRGLVENTAIGDLSAAAAEQQARSVRAAAPDVDAMFISCTNYRTLPALPPLEEAFDIPIVSSNAATIWDLCRQVDVDPALDIELTTRH